MFTVPVHSRTHALGVLLGGTGRALPSRDTKPRVAALMRPGPSDLQRVGHAMTACAARSCACCSSSTANASPPW